jgi:hypothetical protein
MKFITTHKEVTNYLIAYKNGDNQRIEVDFDVSRVADYIEPFFSEDGRTIRVALESDGDEEYEWPEGVEFIQANRRYLNYLPDTEAGEWLERVNSDENLALFLVGVYEHSLVRYSLAGEGLHSTDPFDYAMVGAAIAIPTGPKGFTDPEAAARWILEEYTDWCNGIFFTVVELVKDDILGWVKVTTNVQTIGIEQTQEVINNGY